MLRRHFSTLLAMSVATVARTAEALQSFRGKLSPGAKPSLTGSQGSTLLTGDAGTMLVLGDQRLALDARPDARMAA